MRSLCLLALAVAFGLSLGCGGGDTGPKPPLTEEQQREIQEYDRKVELEEGGGKPQPKAKSGRR